MSAITILRRLPTYDFVMSVELSPRDASERLDAFLRNQPRPRGFVFTDPRVDGMVSGTTFALRHRQSGFGGSVSPYAEGYFVPEGTGSQVFVRTQISPWWWVFDAFILVVLVSSLASSGLEAVLITLPFMLLLLLVASAGPVMVEGSQTGELLTKVLAQQSA